MTYTPKPSPSATDDLVSQVAGYVMLAFDTQARADALEGIRDAEDRLNMRPWVFTRTTADITLAVDAIDYALPDVWGSPFRALLLDAANAERALVGWNDPKTFYRKFPNRSRQGSPVVYTVFNGFSTGTLSLNCFPSAAFLVDRPKLRLYYNAAIQTASAGGAGLAIPRKVESFVKWHAKAHLAASYDPSSYPIAKRESDQAWQMLVEDNNELDFRSSQGGVWGVNASGAGGSVVPSVPFGSSLPSTGNPGDRFRLTGPPDIFYEWMIAADSTQGWVEIYRGPDTYVAP